MLWLIITTVINAKIDISVNKSETDRLDEGTNRMENNILSTLEPFRELDSHLRNNDITIVER